MSNPYDAVFAFPFIHEYTEGFAKVADVERGMTLRDWFAGMALQGFLANPTVPPKEVLSDKDWYERHAEISAIFAYRIADAMMRERETPFFQTDDRQDSEVVAGGGV